ncbi:hypothetical protein [Sphaerisporangium rufum]|uniref:hypothetical protein n=1 Tax=Sphaerisporangium rufum TaxID=1381558 RepID=UPI00194F5D7D|nr:hypothetical protein [Sphaerisporangium rufum]
MTIDVGRNQLRASLSRHQAAAAVLDSGASAALLLFYGAECGLKSSLLERHGLRSTSQLPEHLRAHHDLKLLAKELRLPRSLCDQIHSCTSQQDRRQRVEFRDLHQAWRYGHSLRKEHEEQALVVLHDLLDWCRQELRV